MTCTKRSRGWLLWVVAVMGCSLVGGDLALADEFVDQPAGKHSNITCAPTAAAKDAESLVDSNFATALHNALGDEGFHSLVITFGQCYGGGMMDDLADAFAKSTKPISMTSGSRYDETSGSKPSSSTTKNNGFQRWAEPYQKVHLGKDKGTNRNPTEADAYKQAKARSEWKDSNPKKTSQHKTLNKGGNTKLGDGAKGSGAQSYHAILFAGNTTGRDDYWNDIVRQHKMLVRSGYPAGNIKTLYGGGTAPAGAAEPANAVKVDKAATRQNLLDAIAALAKTMDSQEQLYIYISDHGSPDQGGDKKRIKAKAVKAASNTFCLPRLADYEGAALASTDNTSGPYLEMNITAVGGLITSNWEVYFNDVSVYSPAGRDDNTLPAGNHSDSVRFLVAPELVSAEGNNVWLRNRNETDADIEVELFFSMGDLAVNVEDSPDGSGQSPLPLLRQPRLPPCAGGSSLWPDQIVFFEEVDQSKVLAQMVDGDTHLYGNAFQATLYQDILDYGLPVTFSYGSFNELLLNPAVDENDEPFFQDGRFNAFGLRSVREAMYYLIDRNYIVEEILNGLGVARWTMLDPNFPPYTQAIEACRALELKYQADDATAWALIEADMMAAGAELIAGLWHYNGEPVEIIGLIRVEDERLEIGNYFADKLEAQGFTVERIERRSAELAPIWLLGNPNDGEWSYYTGGWISNLIDRDQGGDYDFQYTPRGWAVPLNQGYPMHLFPEADDAFDKLARRDYATIEERIDLLGIAENGAADCAWDQWLFSAASPWATASDVRVLVDVAAGISGAYIWAHTARFVDADGAPVQGGTMRMASPSMLTQPWNPVAGSNWLYDAMIQRATEDWYIFPDPFTGLGQPHLVERATVTCVEGTPMGATLDYVTVDFVPVINVPADAYCDWDAVNEQFITVGEKFPDGSTARTKTTITYVDDLFGNLWHDGSQFSFADMLLVYITGIDFGKPDSPYYDEATVAATEQFLTVHKGLVIESMDPLTISIYDDRFYLDAEVQVFNRGAIVWPYYSQGMAPWHTLAVGMKAEAAGTTVFSEDKADYLGVDRQNWIAGEQLQLLVNELATAQIENFIPYENVLGTYITDDEVVTRYANLSSFLTTYDHLWVGNGPMMIESIDPIAKIIVGVRFEDYCHDLEEFLAFSNPRFAEVGIAGPDTVAIGSEAVFDVTITEAGEAYPAADMSEIKYLAFDATGELAFSGDGVITGDGAATITLTADDTAMLVPGSSKIEVIAVLYPVAKPSFGSYTYLVY